MSKIYDFIKECGVFYVVTLNGDFPAARPFGAIMEVGDRLYIATHDGNQTHRQLRDCGNMQLIARKDGTREWLRVTAVARESDDRSLKERFLRECPVLVKHYADADNPHYLLFELTVKQTELK